MKKKVSHILGVLCYALGIFFALYVGYKPSSFFNELEFSCLRISLTTCLWKLFLMIHLH